MKFKLLKSILISFAAFLITASQPILPAMAQTPVVPDLDIQIPDSNINTSISLSADYSTPQPNSYATITANLSGTANINNADYSWFLNNVRQRELSGINRNSFTFQVGNLGSVYKISVNISTPGGDNLSDSISISVSDVDLTWSSSSQAPASYKGKLLPTQNSTVIVSALPIIYRPGTKTLFNNNNLIFNWTVDDLFLTDKSGVGKADFLLPIRDFTSSVKSVGLEVRTSSGAILASKSVAIPIVRPQVLIYLADPNSNLPYGASLQNLVIKPVDLNFIVQSYFFNDQPSVLDWQWFLNSEELAEKDEKPWLASLNLTKSKKLFSAEIQVSAKNPANDMETAQSTFNLDVQ